MDISLRLFRAKVSFLDLERVGAFEDLRIDNGEIGAVVFDPFFAWIGSGDSPSSDGMLHHPNLVPDDFPGIEAVLDDAVATLPRAVDR